MASHLETADSKNKIENLSGIPDSTDGNPYEALIDACNGGDKKQIQAVYSSHRETRNKQQREKFLHGDLHELIIDPILLRLEDASIEPGFRDPRHCLVLWARPPDHVLRLAAHLQKQLRDVAPNLWLMPIHRMHMTSLEVAHSKTPSQITSLLDTIRHAIPSITNFTKPSTNRARLVKPMLSYDLAAVAMSFVPAAGEPVVSPEAVPDTDDEFHHSAPHMLSGKMQRYQREPEADSYTYHHLRKDLYHLTSSTGVDVASRYVVPSAHMTLARFLTQGDHSTEELRATWIAKIDEANKWLEKEVWGSTDGGFIGEWCVGQERGLDVRTGPLWYGGGRTVMLGEGF